ncbi:hypothetical protein HYW35_03155 [Candidatus Saccharibacteria bacterium]|nr:hypothetical protein [Candidatus Saccharibacteria bacterium]
MNEGGSSRQPKPELGVPIVPSSGEFEKPPEHSIERRPAAQESVASKPPMPPSNTPALPPMVPVAVPPQDLPDEPIHPLQSTVVNTTNLSAADVDLIEKQWVNAVKTVAAKTRSDPYTQKNEMSKVKADYIHKRFKKIVKTDNSLGVTQSRHQQGQTSDSVAA